MVVLWLVILLLPKVVRSMIEIFPLDECFFPSDFSFSFPVSLAVSHDGKNIGEAIRYYRMAAEKGNHLDSMNNLGLIYRNNSSVRNLNESVRYYKLAIAAGDVNSIVNLANYYKDEETAKDLTEAVKYYKLGNTFIGLLLFLRGLSLSLSLSLLQPLRKATM
jgi:hypothetical protein